MNVTPAFRSLDERLVARARRGQSLWGIQRSPRKAQVAGLCAGVADRFTVDVRLVRVVVLVLLPVSAWLYGLAWLLLPSGESR